MFFTFFVFNDTATTEIYTLSLHDALPISSSVKFCVVFIHSRVIDRTIDGHAKRLVMAASRLHVCDQDRLDRKSTRLNSSHANISYAVFCLKKKNTDMIHHTITYSIHILYY